jgi:hypothetical protein
MQTSSAAPSIASAPIILDPDLVRRGAGHAWTRASQGSDGVGRPLVPCVRPTDRFGKAGAVDKACGHIALFGLTAGLNLDPAVDRFVPHARV